MIIYSDLRDYDMNSPFGLTIGNFDGVHKGHQSLLENIKSKCEERGEELIVMTFTPHPLAVLSPHRCELINSYAERRELIEKLGIKHLCEIAFTRDLSLEKPDSFLEKYVLSNPSLKSLYLGYDFAFGANKSGDYKFIQNYCEKKSIDVENFDEYQSNQGKVSSTSIRQFIKDGEITLANELLGRPYYLRGQVSKGAGRGIQLGFPTANVSLMQGRVSPKKGVYVTQTRIKNNTYTSVTNIGVNPTFSGDQEARVETYILDFNADIYGQDVEVIFHKRLRDEMRFESVEQLKLQIARDVKESYVFFTSGK